MKRLSLAALRTEAAAMHRQIQQESEGARSEMANLLREIQAYGSAGYQRYLAAQARYRGEYVRERNRWFFRNPALIEALELRLREHAPPALAAPAGASQELTDLLRSAASWPVPVATWLQHEAALLRRRVLPLQVRLASIDEEIEKRDAAQSIKAAQRAALIDAAERKDSRRSMRDEVRAAGASTRQRLPRNHPCPYCGRSLGDSPHADHIHPIKKGGRSTPKNMVMACLACNQGKASLTLQQFITAFGLDRDRIEATLLALGKEF